VSTIDTAVRYFTGMDELDAHAATEGWAEDGTYLGIEHRDGKIHRKLYQGKQAIRGYIAAWVAMAAGGIKYTLPNVVGNDKTVMIEWSDVAKTKDGREYRNQGVLVFEFNANGKIQQARAYQDCGPLEDWDFSSGIRAGAR